MVTAYRGTEELPHTQAALTIPYHHLEGLRGLLVSQFKRFVKFVNVLEQDPRVDLEKALKKSTNLPACILWFDMLQTGQPYLTDQAISHENIESTCLFTPKYEGVVASIGTSGGHPTITCTGQLFKTPTLPVRALDVVAKVTPGDGVVEIGAKTKVFSVISNTTVSLETQIFSVGNHFEIHWPLDLRKRFITSRYVNMVLNLYADPDAAYGSGSTIEEVERMMRGWLESDLAQIAFQQYDAQMRGIGFTGRNLSGLMIPGGAAASYLRRVVLSIPLVIGEEAELVWPGVESISIGIEAGADQDDTIATAENFIMQDASLTIEP